MITTQESFNNTIGRLDRILSEFLLLCEEKDDPLLDEANIQTLKHHSDDLIGVGTAMLKKLGLNK